MAGILSAPRAQVHNPLRFAGVLSFYARGRGDTSWLRAEALMNGISFHPRNTSVFSNFIIATVLMLATLWSSAAQATITQGDFSIFGTMYTRWSGRYGEA